MSSGGDIEVIFNADDRDVATSLDRLAQKSGGFAGEVSKASAKVKEQLTGFKNLGPAAGMAVGAAFGLAGKSILDYAEKNDMVRGSLEQMKILSAQTWTAIGRDIASGGTGPAGEFIRAIERARQGTVDFLAGMVSSDVGGVGDAMKTQEQQTKDAREHKSVREETLRIEAEIAAAQGNQIEAARLRVTAEKEAALQRINAMNLTSGPEKDGLIALVNQKAAVDMKQARDEADKEKKRAFDAEWEKNGRLDAADRDKREKADADAKQRAMAKENLDFELQAAEIDAIRATASKEEVKQMEAELDLARKISEIQRNDLLSARDKEVAIDKLKALSALEGAGGKNKSEERFATIESGVNARVASVSASVRGGTPMMQVAVKTLAANERTARAVEKLASDGVPAKLG